MSEQEPLFSAEELAEGRELQESAAGLKKLAQLCDSVKVQYLEAAPAAGYAAWKADYFAELYGKYPPQHPGEPVTTGYVTVNPGGYRAPVPKVPPPQSQLGKLLAAQRQLTYYSMAFPGECPPGQACGCDAYGNCYFPAGSIELDGKGLVLWADPLPEWKHPGEGMSLKAALEYVKSQLFQLNFVPPPLAAPEGGHATDTSPFGEGPGESPGLKPEKKDFKYVTFAELVEGL